MIFEQVAIVGIGLIGSSIAHAIKRKDNIARTVVGTDKNQSVCDTVHSRLSVFDKVSPFIEEVIPNSDLVILCVPVGSMKRTAQFIQPYLKRDCIISDVGSVKQSVIQDVGPFIPRYCHFIPAHPIAGTEFSGPEAGFSSLFDNRWNLITPLPDTDNDKLNQLCDFWRALGANIDIMPPERHDLVLAITSHLPHLIAYNIVGTAAHLEKVSENEVIKYSASGFRDFTRLASSDPTMWRDIFLNNKDAVIEMLGRFTEDLIDLQRAIRYSDGDRLFELFARSREVRKQIVEAGQDTNKPNFGRG